MDEILDLVDTLADSGFEGVVIWILRFIGIVALLAGLGLWLLTEMGILVLPLVLLVGGLVLLIAPSIVLVFAEVFE
jgi:hypothetical protein